MKKRAGRNVKTPFKRLCSLLSGILFTFIVTAQSFAATVESRIVSGEFRYLSVEERGFSVGTFFYCDDYFAVPGTAKNEHLRTLSLDLAMSAFGSKNTELNSSFSLSLLEDMGFSFADAEVTEMEEKPTADTLGTVISHRRTRYGEVIAVAVRGGYYGSEWANTLDSGNSGSVKGLSLTADKLVARIKEYERKYSLSGAKLWITSYSRGGAVSDLAGRYINEHLGEFGITEDDLYVYTFEAPAAGDKRTGYKNIHNVFDPCDIVPMLYPEKWGLYRAGIDEKLDSEDSLLRYKQLDLDSGEKFTDKYSWKFDRSNLKGVKIYAEPVRMSQLGKDFIDWLAASSDRQTYAKASHRRPCFHVF